MKGLEIIRNGRKMEMEMFKLQNPRSSALRETFVGPWSHSKFGRKLKNLQGKVEDKAVPLLASLRK